MSGFAEMGFNGGSAAGQETEMFQDLDVSFTMSGETDNGISFGAGVDLDETAAGTIVADDNGTTVFISGAFGTLTMGDTDGALDWAITEGVGNPGSIADDETGAGAYTAISGGLDGTYDGQVLRYNNSVNGLGFAISVEQDDTGARDDGAAFGVTYSFNGVNLGAAMQSATTAAGAELDATAVSANTTVADVAVGVAFMDVDSSVAGGDYDVTVLSAGTTVGASSFGVIVSERNGNGAVDGVGGAYSYNLGGGASMKIGYGDTDGGDSTWSAGIAMSF